MMDLTKNEVEAIITECCDALKEQKPMLFMKQHDINERTMTAALGASLETRFDGLHVDCEYNRMTDENGIQIPKRIGLDPNSENPSSVYPDIIVHRQEDAAHNLLILEVKMSWKNDKKQDDIDKLNLYIEELKYKFGLYLELGEAGIAEKQWF